MTSTLERLKSVRGMSLAEILLIFPDGRRQSLEADEEALTTDAGMHVLRASFEWEGGESRSRAKVVIQKPFVVVGPSEDARQGRNLALGREEEDPMMVSEEDAKDMVKLWLWFFALAALFFVWSAVTNCRASGR